MDYYFRILSYAILFICAAIAGAGGIGGGGVHVALLITLFDMEYKKAAVYSLCLVCGSCFCQAIVNYHRKHPAFRSKNSQTSAPR